MRWKPKSASRHCASVAAAISGGSRKPKRASSGLQPHVDRIGGVIERRREQRRQHEGEDDRRGELARDMAELHAEEGDDQAELGNLRQAHRRHFGVPLVRAGPVEQREEDDLARKDGDDRDEHGDDDNRRSARRGNAEAEADEEQRDEEVLHHADLGDDLGRIGQARHASRRRSARPCPS